MKRLFTCFFILSAALLLPPILRSNAEYEVAGAASTTPVLAPQTPQIEAVSYGGYYEGEQFTHSEIDAFLVGTTNTTLLRKLIKCESQNQNVARMDDNGLMSFGILQFNGTATWDTFAPLAGVSSSPMNPVSAIKVADWMISNGQLARWGCARKLHLL
jgi:hypothetical protein